MPTDIFVDTTLSAGANNGTSFDDAYQSLRAVLVASRSPSDRVWVRRVSLEYSAAGQIVLNGNGTEAAPIEVIGWPRAVKTTSGDFTNGSKTVDNIASNDMVSYGHDIRNITGPDGNRYWIESITDTNTIVLNKEYIGANASTASFTIDADDKYTEAQAIDDSTWTIKKIDWNSDPDPVPGVVQTAIAGFDGSNDFFWRFYNFRITAYARNGFSGSYNIICTNVYFVQLYGNAAITQVVPAGAIFKNCLFYHTGDSSGIHSTMNNFGGDMINCFVNVASTAFYCMNISSTTQLLKFIDCNFSIPVVATFNVTHACTPLLLNCYFGATPKIFRDYFLLTRGGYARFENFQRTMGDNRIFSQLAGWIVSNDGSGVDVNLRSGGADKVIDILFDIDLLGNRPENDKIISLTTATLVFEHRIWQTALTPKTYRYYVQSVTDSLTSGELWLEVEDAYGNITKSDESISARGNADDWNGYIEASVTQPIEDWIILRVFCAKYSATNHRYIDPKVEVIG